MTDRVGPPSAGLSAASPAEAARSLPGAARRGPAPGAGARLAFRPGLAISLTVFGLNLVGDAIRDVTAPKLRGGLG